MTDTNSAPVLLDVTDGVATITINRPDAMNSLDVATKEALLDAVRKVADDPEARCVVLTGTGRAFCTGQDLKEHIRILESGSSESLFRTVDEHYNPIVTVLATMAKPVIAAVNGVAAGAGASLAFACDLRLLADTAGFNLAFANVALSCDTGASYHLQRLVGRAKALELLYFPSTLKADAALSLGLATRVVPADELAAIMVTYPSTHGAYEDTITELCEIVHGHGGTVLVALALKVLHNDIGCSYEPNSWGERYHWYSSTGWVMWNCQANGLLNGTTCCIYDGNPGGLRDKPVAICLALRAEQVGMCGAHEHEQTEHQETVAQRRLDQAAGQCLQPGDPPGRPQ